MGEWRRPHNDLRLQVCCTLGKVFDKPPALMLLQVVGGGHKAIHDDDTAREAGIDYIAVHIQ